MTDYAEFVASKFAARPPAGFDRPARRLPRGLREWQRRIVLWALARGRAALFVDTGLGKTLMQLAWGAAVAKFTSRPVLLFCPLAVGPQTVREAAKFGIKRVAQAATQADVTGPGVWVTNYQKLHHFDPAAFGGVVLDESSILKGLSGSVRRALTAAFAATPYRLCCTATPAPNDHTEIAGHAEFLGVCKRSEMLATYFVHDGGSTADWRLKGHAVTAFWEWVASWAVVARRPSDLGYPDDGYDLPPLRIHRHEVTTVGPADRLFAVAETTLDAQRKARRETLAGRVQVAAELANAEPDSPCLVWCELNDESAALAAAIGGAIEVTGSTPDDEKAAAMLGFADGTVPRIVSKPSLCGFGMNFQACNRMIFVGPSHSFEQFYQAVRRCWRYGQTRPVDVHIVTSDREAAVFDNVERKQREHDALFAGVVSITSRVNREALGGKAVSDRPGNETGETARGDGWELRHGDCVEGCRGMPAASVGFTVFSPPFVSLYTFSDDPRDMSNNRGRDEFFAHFRYLIPELLRVTVPGRLCAVHCCNYPLMKERDGVIGLSDFRGDLIREFTGAEWIFHSEICVWKDPVTEMQRTKSLGLLWKQVRKDAAMSRMGIPDYYLVFRRPGENPEPVTHAADEFPVEVWQRYASPVWSDIDQGDTLNYRAARDEPDERHICPLQLGAVRRCVELWSNPGDLVYSPFTGIGTEGFIAVSMGRRFAGDELKRSYFDQAAKNLTRAARESRQTDLFADVS